jgi:hypothetical protein
VNIRAPGVKGGEKGIYALHQGCHSGLVPPVTELESDRGSLASGHSRSWRSPSDALRFRWILLAAIAGPIAAALVLTPWRGHLDTADNALILVVVIVAVASTGRRLAAGVAALVSALSFDFFLTRPYGSFRITSDQDLITELLLVVVGFAVGELAARGRTHRVAASERTQELALLHSVTELAASGQDSRLVIEAALVGLQQLLSLRNCHFTRHDCRPAHPGGRGHLEGSVVDDRGPRSSHPSGRPPRAKRRVAARPLPPHTDTGHTGIPPATRRCRGHRRPGGRLVGGRPSDTCDPSMKGRTPDMTTSRHTLRGTHG